MMIKNVSIVWVVYTNKNMIWKHYNAPLISLPEV